jgi:hypothetical protein
VLGQDVLRGWFLENWAFIARHSDSRGLSIYTGVIEFNMTASRIGSGRRSIREERRKIFRSKFLCHGLDQKKDSLCFSSMICNEVESLNMDNSR